MNTYGYVGGNPLANIDPFALDCIAGNRNVTCFQVGLPTITFPRPGDWPDVIMQSDFNYHSYNKWTNAGDVNAECLRNYIKKNPTPNPKQSPATIGGAPNDATPPKFSGLGLSPVISYVVNSNGHRGSGPELRIFNT